MEGDTIGVVIVADEHESVQSLMAKLRDATSLRTRVAPEMELVYNGIVLDPATTLTKADFVPLQRFDVRRKHGISESRNP
jgi:hypothetical protein